MVAAIYQAAVLMDVACLLHLPRGGVRNNGGRPEK